MKHKLKVLAAGIALAFNGSANASIVSGDTWLVLFAPNLASLSSERSFHLNLGTTLDQFRGGINNLSWDLTTYSQAGQNIWSTNFSGKPLLQFSVAATNAGTDTYNITGTGGLASFTPSIQTGTDIQQTGGVIFNKQGELNTAANAANGAGANYALVDPNSPAFIRTAWGSDANGTLSPSVQTLGNSGALVPFYAIFNNGEFDPGTAQFLGSFKLNDTGTLTYSAVPIPAAAWLMGSALAALFGFGSRRRKS